MLMNFGKLLLSACALVLLATGCAPTMRMVTASHWSNGDTLYLAYAEKTGTSIVPKVKKCSRQANNQLQCADQEKINPLLDPDAEAAPVVSAK